MKVTIAHLYYDLLNLYGENGNIKALKYALEGQGIDVSIKFLTIGDTINFDEYDFIYMGMGTEENQKLVLKDLLSYKKEIKKKIEEGKFFLITGNAIELFGKSIQDKKEKNYKALGIFPFHAKEEIFRMADEALLSCEFIDKPILGFQNQSSVIKDNNTPMFEVIKGIGSYPKSTGEGVRKNNFFGTYLIGPILVRNPGLLEYITKELILAKEPTFQFQKFNLDLEKKAYEHFMKDHYKEYSTN